VRPEDVRFAEHGGLAARVSAVEYLGADSIVTCAVADESIAVRAPGRVELREGTSVHLVWDPDDEHHFKGGLQ